jgi:hypothetical protein
MSSGSWRSGSGFASRTIRSRTGLTVIAAHLFAMASSKKRESAMVSLCTVLWLRSFWRSQSQSRTTIGVMSTTGRSPKCEASCFHEVL